MTEWVLSIMEQLGYLGIALLMFLDNIFPPIPSEVIMPSAGYTASQGDLQLIGVIIAGSCGSLIAAALLYWIGRKIPQQTLLSWVDHYGKYLFIKSKDVRKALDWFEKYGHRVVFFGRMIPAVRSLISIPAGMSGMQFSKFMLYSALGTVIWTTFLACIGFYLGENQALMQNVLHKISFIVITVLILYLVVFVVKKYVKK